MGDAPGLCGAQHPQGKTTCDRVVGHNGSHSGPIGQIGDLSWHNPAAYPSPPAAAEEHP